MLGICSTGLISHNVFTVFHGLTVNTNKLVTKTTLTPSRLHVAGNLPYSNMQPRQIQGKRCHWQPFKLKLKPETCLSILLFPCEHPARTIWQIFMFKEQLKLHMPLGAEKVSPLLIKHVQTEGRCSQFPFLCFHYSQVDRYGFMRH